MKEPQVVYHNGIATTIPSGLCVVYVPKGEAREYAALALNVYMGCEHHCSYCYAAQAIHKSKEQFFQRPTPRPNFLANLAHDIGKLAPFAADLPPVHISFIGDPFQPCEDEYHVTRDTIRLLKQSGLSVQLLTKAAHVADETMALLDQRDWFGVTLAGDCLEELGAGKPWERLSLLNRAQQEYGLNVWVSMEPLIDLPSVDWGVRLARADHYKYGPLNYAKRNYELADAAREVRRVMEIYGYEEGAAERGRKTFYLKRSLREVAG